MKISQRISFIFGLGLLLIVLINACNIFPGNVGTGWGEGAFDSNGERIYFTATNSNGERITYTGGPPTGGMMGGDYLVCASCHGPDAEGGLHAMMGMQVMDAPDIRWDSLAAEEEDHGSDGEGHGDSEYNLEIFRMAVVEGLHPDGEPLSEDMPRWNMGDEDLEDLSNYLMSFD